MNTKVHSFSFLMELIVVIFFFALSSTICISLIVKGKEKQRDAQIISDDLLDVQTVIETMQAHPFSSPVELFDAQKKNQNTYTYHHLTIVLRQDKSGVVKMESTKQEFPFVLGGSGNE